MSPLSFFSPHVVNVTSFGGSQQVSVFDMFRCFLFGVCYVYMHLQEQAFCTDNAKCPKVSACGYRLTHTYTYFSYYYFFLDFFFHSFISHLSIMEISWNDGSLAAETVLTANLMFCLRFSSCPMLCLPPKNNRLQWVILHKIKFSNFICNAKSYKLYI